MDKELLKWFREHKEAPLWKFVEYEDQKLCGWESSKYGIMKISELELKHGGGFNVYIQVATGPGYKYFGCGASKTKEDVMKAVARAVKWLKDNDGAVCAFVPASCALPADEGKKKEEEDSSTELQPKSTPL